MSDQTANAGTQASDPNANTDETGQQDKNKDNKQNNDDNLETLWDNPVDDKDKTNQSRRR